MAAHRTIRSFRPTPVPDEAIERAVDAARMAATSSWAQGYGLLQVTRRNERETLAELTGDQSQVAKAGAFFTINADIRRHQVVASREGKPHANNLEVFLLVAFDAVLFAQNLALAFEADGWGTCFIGGLRTRLPEVCELLEIPKGVFPLFGLCVGEPAEDPGTRPRFEPDAIWSKDRCPTDDTILRQVNAHDAVAAAYYAQRGADGRNWSGGTVRKFMKPLRKHLKATYESLGAKFD
jgi:FMN reductase (NADPH)